MKLEEDLKAVRYIRNHIDLIVNEEGYVILPAWQFVRLVDEYENHRRSSIMWLVVLLLLVVWFVFWLPML